VVVGAARIHGLGSAVTSTGVGAALFNAVFDAP
jgi:hypothetical protein